MCLPLEAGSESLEMFTQKTEALCVLGCRVPRTDDHSRPEDSVSSWTWGADPQISLLFSSQLSCFPTVLA